LTAVEMSGYTSDDALMQEPKGFSRRRWAPVALAAALGVAATAAVTRSVVLRGSPSQVVGMAEMVANPPADQCSKKLENCLDTRCCAVSGYTCFQKNASYGGCMKKCKSGPDGHCQVVAPIMKPVVEWPGLSLFCFSVYTKDTGSTKQSFELELLTEQLKRGASIFSCAGWAVYSDAKVELGPGVSTIKVNDAKQDFHKLTRPKVGGWINTGMFVQVWKQIAADGVWSHHNWVAKVDPDAVFFPWRLTTLLQGKSVPPEGVYVENCKFVDYGYFGNLEVFSKVAFGTMLQNLDTCYDELDWETGIDGGKYGPMGEDLFAQRCMDKHGVSRVHGYKFVADGACPADRPKEERKNKKFKPTCAGATTATIHPFKKPHEYFKCMEEALGQ
jgi:hypothetical protein